jgi:hypothetical protein
MRLPERYRPLARAHLGIEIDDEGRPRAWPAPATYPPPGFLPISPFQLGNGDVFGLYWPLGQEGAEPIVCELQHDAWALDPCAADLEGLLRFLAAFGRVDADGPDHDDFEALASALNVQPPPNAGDADGEPPPALDPSSPSGSLQLARLATQRGELQEIERHLSKSVTLLPEFGEAWLAMAQLRRRKGDVPGSARALVEALGSPMCFGGDRERVLREMQRIPEGAVGDLATDPVWQRRGQFTFRSGQKHSEDYRLLEESASAYLATGQGVRAARLRVLLGERMSGETTAFQERHGFTRARHLATQRAEFAQAGLSLRMPALGP